MFGATDQGLVRSSNQDAFFCNADFGLAIVSDGMGGHKGGEIASKLTVDGLKDAYMSSKSILVENVGPFLDEVLQKINQEIFNRSLADINLRGMGATVNYLQFAGGKLALGHAGDSRTYLIRKCKAVSGADEVGMWQLSIDHNVGTFVERGLLTIGKDLPSSALTERHKARLMRGMGVVHDLKADLYIIALEENDVLLSCSDGLHGFVTEEKILSALCNGPLNSAPQRLIELTKQFGAPDNVTVVVSVFSEEEDPVLKAVPVRRSPFLLRHPSGEISGCFEMKDILEKLQQGLIPPNCEVSKSLMSWVFLSDESRLFQIYSEFDNSLMRTMMAKNRSAAADYSLIPDQVDQKPSRVRMVIWCIVAIIVGAILGIQILEYLDL